MVDYWALRKTLRTSGFGSVIFGVLAMLSGAATLDRSPFNAILAAVGFLLFAEGIWLITSPSPKGLIADGIALIVIGLMNIIITINDSVAGDN